MSIKDTLLDKYQEQMANLALSAKKAQTWFNAKVKTVSGNELMQDRPRLVTKGQLSRRHVGRLVMYYYDPKTKDKLPYYDRFPLSIIVDIDNQGFYGLNLHYLPVGMRVKLLDALVTIYKNKQLDENKKLTMSYKLLKASSKTRFFKPCFKRYLYGHVRSRFYVVDPVEWEMVLTLPTERFEKKDKAFVWEESKKSLGAK